MNKLIFTIITSMILIISYEYILNKKSNIFHLSNENIQYEDSMDVLFKSENIEENKIIKTMNDFGFGKDIAILIGVGEYKDSAWENLKAVQSDVISIKDFLINESGFEEVHILTNDYAKKDRINEIIDKYDHQINQIDRVLFYYIGHGVTEKRYGNQEYGYLPLTNSVSGRYGTMISMSEISEWSARLGKARQSLFILNSCVSGLAGFQRQGDDRQFSISGRLKEAGHHLLTSARAEEASYASQSQTYFTSAFLEAVRGAADGTTSPGIVTLSELTAYVRDRLDDRLGKGRSMTPQMRVLGRDAGEFFFLYDIGKTKQNITRIEDFPNIEELKYTLNPLINERYTKIILENNKIDISDGISVDKIISETIIQEIKTIDNLYNIDSKLVLFNFFYTNTCQTCIKSYAFIFEYKFFNGEWVIVDMSSYNGDSNIISNINIFPFKKGDYGIVLEISGIQSQQSTDYNIYLEKVHETTSNWKNLKPIGEIITSVTPGIIYIHHPRWYSNIYYDGFKKINGIEYTNICREKIEVDNKVLLYAEGNIFLRDIDRESDEYYELPEGSCGYLWSEGEYYDDEIYEYFEKSCIISEEDIKERECFEFEGTTYKFPEYD